MNKGTVVESVTQGSLSNLRPSLVSLCFLFRPGMDSGPTSYQRGVPRRHLKLEALSRKVRKVLLGPTALDVLPSIGSGREWFSPENPANNEPMPSA